MMASYRGHVEIVELLLEFGSDVNLTTEVKKSISHTIPTKLISTYMLHQTLLICCLQ